MKFITEPLLASPTENRPDTSLEKNFNLIIDCVRDSARGEEALRNKEVSRLLKSMAGETQGFANKSGVLKNRDKIGYEIHAMELQRFLADNFGIDISEYV